jgi:hypothetical protein
MKLDEILSAKTAQVAPVQDHAIIFLNGAIEPDPEREYFRIYSDPNNRRAYCLVRKADVTLDVHEWTSEELSRAGFVGTKVYRVPLRHGCEILTVSVRVEKLGETLAGDKVGASEPAVCAVGDIRCIDGERQRCIFSSTTGPFWHTEGACKCP